MHRILFFNYEFPPLGGGSGNANAYLFREFARSGNLAVDCVTSSPGREDETDQLHNAIRLFRLAVGKRNLHFWTQRELGRYLLRAGSKARELLERNEYELCHAFGGFPPGFLAWRFSRRLPYVLSLRGSDVPGFNPRFKWQYRVLKPVFRRIWRGARVVTANSAELAELAGRLAPDIPIRVIPNGVDCEEFSPAPTSPAAGNILCVSRLVERKGVRHLLDAFPEVLRRHPGSRLTLVGEGDLKEALKDQAVQLGCEDRVRFAGQVPHDDLPGYYRRAGVLVQPSFHEGMSNAVLEAMACSLPIVTTSRGGARELCGGNAVTVEFGDPQSLARVLSDLLDRPEQVAAMGVESRRIAERFSWGSAAAVYLELYREISVRPGGMGKR